MAHCGGLGSQRVPEDLHDIRGTIVRGPEGQKLGKVNDVIFDHDTMEIRYLVLPERPAGTEALSEEQLAELVTRDSMIGVAKSSKVVSA